MLVEEPHTASTTNESAVITAPATSGTFEPKRTERRPPNGLKIIIAIVQGTRKRPAWVTVEPKPYPVEVGDCTYCGIRTKALYIPKPISSAVRFVVQTPRSRIIAMSTSGCVARASARTQATARTTASRSSPSVFGEPQPHEGAWLT